ncbi:MAG: hypothetical protein CV087_07355 [Candidatus Brocadia sp. WS118]|nr:MAG: hypothetical protein CV087_07355 [Candidatus Brocadia sp. WS118]
MNIVRYLVKNDLARNQQKNLASFVENTPRLVYIYCMENPFSHFNKAEKNIYQEKPGWNRLDV